MKSKRNQIAILERLGNIPAGAEIMRISTSVAWLVCVKVSQAHFYYIVVDKKADRIGRF